MFKRVLILSASAGAGHIRAAQALEEAFRTSGAAQEVKHVDILQYTNGVFRQVYSKGYIHMVNKAPRLLGWLYDYCDIPWKDYKRRIAFETMNTTGFARMVKRYNPDLVICTHFLPAGLISKMRAQGEVFARHAVVVTDMDMHAMWMCKNYEHYFVALEETKHHLGRIGINTESVHVTGIPVDPVFSQLKDKAQMRAQLGLAQDRAVIMVSAGGFGVGPIEELIGNLLLMHNRAQLVVMCGRNERLKNQLESLAAAVGDDGNVAIKAVGYTQKMDEYMAAADLLVGKPGGLTTSEALSRGLPLVIVNPIPGQEERNADHFLEQGVAVRCNNLPALSYKIDCLLNDEVRFESMRANALRLGKPDAAREIVNCLVRAEAEPTSAPIAQPLRRKRPRIWQRQLQLSQGTSEPYCETA
jgi:processive 1,2-diacylglycerol beta-glucosyltransferase